MTRSSHELIKCLSILLIVYRNFGVLSPWSSKDRYEKSFIEILSSGGAVGINLFMIVSGYLLAGKPVQVTSAIRTWLITVEYSWSIFACMLWQRYREIGTADYHESVFPVACYGYWLVSLYMVTMTLSPVFGKVTTSLSHQEYVGTLSVMFLSMSMMGYFHIYAFSPVFWFLFLYMIGSYLRLYHKVYEKISTKDLFVGLSALVTINIVTINYFSGKQYRSLEKYGGPSMLISHGYSPLAIIMAVNIFLLFERFSFRSQTANNMGNASLAVYLITENKYLRWIIWPEWINASEHSGSAYFYLYSLVSPLVVFLLCTAVELIRQYYFSNTENYLVDKIEQRVVIPAKAYLGGQLDILEV